MFATPYCRIFAQSSKELYIYFFKKRQIYQRNPSRTIKWINVIALVLVGREVTWGSIALGSILPLDGLSLQASLLVFPLRSGHKNSL